MERPSVDVVVPFAGSAAAMESAMRTLHALRRRRGDTITLVDNRPDAGPAADGDIRIVPATERRSSYFARNRGAREGTAPWLLFLDADVRPDPGLLDAYLEPPPGENAGVLVGAVIDEEAGPHAPLAARYAAAQRPMAQEITLASGYGQTANCAVRRAAFEAVGGFADAIRSGGDADLCFRLERAGWGLEPRPTARGVHANRTSLPALLRQKARHGSGVAWLEARYPGTFPKRGFLGVAAWTARHAPSAARAYRRGEREAARLTLVELAAAWAFELGRHLPNEVR
jgi:GT2 family glycosyltransferase